VSDSDRQRLAAILAADAAGYSRLMEIDERMTVAALDAARRIFKAEIESNHGRVINMAGDSVLAVFDTAAGAVTAALAAQRELEQSSLDVPAERRMRFRIGVHLGDVIEKPDGDLYGDGVNIAARLQTLAEPGGIIVSEAVRGAVKSRVAAAFDDRGMQAVKNIADPIRAFSVRLDGVPQAPARAAGKPMRWLLRPAGLVSAAGAALLIVVASAVWLRSGTAPPIAATSPGTATATLSAPGKPSIAVLPFDNMSGDAAQAYFADGITEDLITDLSKVSGLFVIARNSTFAYKGKSRDIREIGKALGVRYVLEGSVQKSGTNVRVNAQLIDAASGGHVWADRYDGELKNIFGLQDTVTRNVVKAMAVELTKDDKARVASGGTANVRAYDVFLKGWEHYLRQTPEEFRAAIVDFKKAAELDPNYGRAYAALAATYWESYTRYWGLAMGIGQHVHDAQYEAEQSLVKAMRNPTPLAHKVASAMLVQAQQQQEAIVEAKLAIAADPNDADGYIALARALSFAGRSGEALEAVDRAMRLNPHYPSEYEYQRGLAQFGLNRIQDATASLERAVALNHEDYWSQRLLLSTYGLLGRRDDATRLASALTMTLKDYRDPLSVRAVAFWYPFANPDDAKRFADGLRKAGIPE
jgi:adenylate cyclase